MSKAKAKIATPVVTSKVGKLRDPQATAKLSLKLGFVRNARLNASA
ncbi:hypothetical protein Acj9p051 [Acinetobacter phage Acj9]|uniref:Uncharacterized protein n=1 Tax=Acinetobacter phage Acj9 TaxID=760939 RepID=E5EPI5_9CAUD|nr:hypothetical protein Acj9p051 [Acinetobacter phage Acj9]ADG59951.1 hypothetical protein Acj9p051 [Acinetobacter phage Acj9]